MFDFYERAQKPTLQMKNSIYSFITIYVDMFCQNFWIFLLWVIVLNWKEKKKITCISFDLLYISDLSNYAIDDGECV